mgnify:CR=1 FL=1
MAELISELPPGLKDLTDCIVMYGGGLTSYEAARLSINKFGHDATEIWFADTRNEDEDLYRFNDDVEKILNHKIITFDQGVDIWGIFRRERYLGNSRIDPCSKFLKRVPLRKALDTKYCEKRCTNCLSKWEKGLHKMITIQELDGMSFDVYVCNACCDTNKKYANLVRKTEMAVERDSSDSYAARLAARVIDRRIEPCSPDGRFVRVVLGMDIIQDCDRLHRAAMYWRPYVNWFPLAEPPYGNKSRIITELSQIGIGAPRLYAAGFEHNNCGGFCVKAGMGQMVHLLETLPERYAYHENKELEFQEWIGKDVSILTQTRNGVKHNLTLRELRTRVESGEEFAFTPGTACACLNPATPD